MLQIVSSFQNGFVLAKRKDLELRAEKLLDAVRLAFEERNVLQLRLVDVVRRQLSNVVRQSF